MKVILVNGSPKPHGNTESALKIVSAELLSQGIEPETVEIGTQLIRGCIGCGGCVKANGCVFGDKFFGETAEKIYAADGVVFGTPVYYAGMNGTLKAFLDRFFYSSRGRMRHKVGAGVAVVRRCGGMTAFDQLNSYFLLSEMLIAPSFYWNVAYGQAPGEVNQDAEGVSILQNLARNMAWMIKMKEQTKDALPPPIAVERQWMNFIRS